MRKSIAKEYLIITNQWEETSPEIIARNIERYLVEKYPECEGRSAMQRKLSEMTGSSIHTAYAWMNKSRNNVKIPLVKLCMIADALKTDVRKFMEAEI